MSEKQTPVDVGKLYDKVSTIADTIGEGQFHQAYWYDERDDATLIEAAKRITRRVAGSLGLGKDEHVLDAGCGPGGSALLIAEETGARVTGISVSDFDIAEAQRRAIAAGLTERVHFERGDYSAIGFPDGTFDAVMAVESLLVAPDLDKVLSEFHRVLRPGGRVTLSHFTREEAMGKEQLESFLSSFRGARLPTVREWIDALRRNGFALDEYLQCGPRVAGMNSRYIAMAEQRRGELVEKFGPEAMDMFYKGLRGYLTPSPEEIGYAIVTGRKPY